MPPDQSCTASEQPASASSASFRRSCRVTLVSRVPKTKVCTLRRSESAWRKCSISREYWLIEPEMSQSATIGGCISARARKAGTMMSPPTFSECAHGAARIDAAVRGASSAGASAAGRRAERAPRAPASPRRSRRRSSARNPCAAALRAPRRSAARRSRSRARCSSRRGSGPSASRARVSPARGFSFSPGRGGATGESIASIFSISPRLRQNSSNASWKTARCSRFFTKTEWSVQ